MKIYGLDFTSAPDASDSQARKKKRLLLAKSLVIEVPDDILKGSDRWRIQGWL